MQRYYSLVIIRHGESEWNKQNRFTGWVDVDLSARGLEEASLAGQLLKEAGYSFDLAYVSLQRRAIKTLWSILEQLEMHWIPVEKHWRLNERHYGALQGLDKAETVAQHGEAQVKIWRRSFDIPPPLIARTSSHYPAGDKRYADIDPRLLPLGESLQDVCKRVEPYWQQAILPAIRSGKKLIISAHGNSLRALAMMLTDMSKEEVVEFNIPTAEPILFKLDDSGHAVKMDFINDAKTIKAKQQAAGSTQQHQYLSHR